MPKSITTAALIRQIDALVEHVVACLRAAHHALPALPRASEVPDVTGDIRQVGIAANLTILEMDRRTGRFVANGAAPNGGELAPPRATLTEIAPTDRLELVARARLRRPEPSAMGVPARPIEVVRAMMRLAVGRFSFKPDAKARLRRRALAQRGALLGGPARRRGGGRALVLGRLSGGGVTGPTNAARAWEASAQVAAGVESGQASTASPRSPVAGAASPPSAAAALDAWAPFGEAPLWAGRSAGADGSGFWGSRSRRSPRRTPSGGAPPA